MQQPDIKFKTIQDNLDLQQNLLKLVKLGHRRHNVFYQFALPPISLFSFVLAYVASQEAIFFEFFPTCEDKDRTIALIMGAVFSLLAVIALIEFYFKVKKDRYFIDIIQNHPEEIAWIYKSKTRTITDAEGITIQQEFFHVFFHLIDGKKFSLWLKEKQANQTLSLAKKLFKLAKIGYNNKPDYLK